MQNSKRMRLGTRSCAECRRRKIRCVLLQGRTTCESCNAHGTPCLAQQPKSDSPADSAKASEDEDIKGRLAELEFIVGQMHGPLSLSNGSNSKSGSSITPGTEEENASTSTAFTTSPNPPSNDRAFMSAHGWGSVNAEDIEEPKTFADAPLLNLFNLTNLATRSRSVFQVDVGTSQRTENLINTAIQLIPSQTAVQAVLDEVAKFFGCWPPCSYDPGNSLYLQANNTDQAFNFIHLSLYNRKPSLVAKAILFWAHCILQLPHRSPCHKLLPGNLIALTTEYTSLASALLFISAGRGDNIDGIEAKSYLYKLAIDLGKPRLAWTTARAAVESCLMLGFHREDSNSQGKAIWSRTWGLDRQPSVLLGLFPTITNGHPALPALPNGASLFAQINYSINILFGAICERDQQNREKNYSKTVEIDQMAADMLSLLPPEWSDPLKIAVLSLEDRYHILIIHIRTQAIVRSIHLPWMLKFTGTETRYRYSRTACLQSARAGNRYFSLLRKDPELSDFNCELMDHESFLNSIVLIVGRLTDAEALSQCIPSAESREDFSILYESALCLRTKAEQTGCVVAAQGSKVLDYLLGAMRRDPKIPDHFETAIPAFGQVRIDKRVVEHFDGLSGNLPTTEASTGQDLSHVIEFTADPFHQQFPFEFTFGNEVTTNWQEVMDWNAEYNWTHVFSDFDFGTELHNVTAYPS